MVSFFVFGQHNHLVAVILHRFVQVVFTHEKFTPEDGRDLLLSFFFRLFFEALIMGIYSFDKVKSPHHIGMVRKGHGRHVLAGCCLDEIFDLDCGLEYRELGVVMQVHKGSILQCFLIFQYFIRTQF